MKKAIAIWVCLWLCLLTAAAQAEFLAETAAKMPGVADVHITGKGILNLDLDKSVKLPVTISYQLNGQTVFTHPATLKLQGNSSLQFEKKNYSITLFADDELKEKCAVPLVAQWGAQSKYCLKANWIDSTHARNLVSARLAAQMQAAYGLMQEAPNRGVMDGYPVRLFVNDEYRGLYTWNMPKDAWAYGMDTKNPDHIVLCAESQDGSSSVAFKRESPAVAEEEWSIETGPKKTQDELDSTFEKLNRVIRFVRDSSDEEFRSDFGEYLNLDATLNYFCFIALSNAFDNAGKNMLMVTYDGQHWYPTLYDMDTTRGLSWAGNWLYDPITPCPLGYGMPDNLLWNRLIACFPQELQKRYFELRGGVLSDANIMAAFRDFESSVPEAYWQEEHDRWPDIPSLSWGLDQIEAHLAARSTYIDACMEQLYIEKSEEPGVLYRLPAPYSGKSNRFKDTGTQVFFPDGSDQDFSLLVRFRSQADAGARGTILSQRNLQREGMLICSAADGSDDYTMFWMGADSYDALYKPDSKPYITIALRKTGDTYTIYSGDASNCRVIADSHPLNPIDGTIIIGAENYVIENGMPRLENCFQGVISDLVIYDASMSEEQLLQALVDMHNSPFREPEIDHDDAASDSPRHPLARIRSFTRLSLPVVFFFAIPAAL